MTNEAIHPTVRRNDHIPRNNKGPEVVRIAAGANLEVTALSTAVEGFDTHWNGKSSDPCFDPKETCPGCKKGHPQRWHGYLHVYIHGPGVQAFLDLPPVASSTLMHCLPSGENLRGCRIKLSRSEKSKRGEIFVSVQPKGNAESLLPQELSVWPVLRKLWGLDNSYLPNNPTPVQ